MNLKIYVPESLERVLKTLLSISNSKNEMREILTMGDITHSYIISVHELLCYNSYKKHQIFLKRAIFEKKHFIVFLVQIYTKITKKNVDFEILANITPSLRNDFFRTWHPCSRIWHSCLNEVVQSVTSRFFARET